MSSESKPPEFHYFSERVWTFLGVVCVVVGIGQYAGMKTLHIVIISVGLNAILGTIFNYLQYRDKQRQASQDIHGL